MPMTKILDTILDAIENGDHDDVLDAIVNAVRDRQKLVARRGLRAISEGDKVRFSEKIRPAYLKGLSAVVTKVNGASVVVTIANDPSYGRFAGAKNVRVPATLIEAAP